MEKLIFQHQNLKEKIEQIKNNAADETINPRLIAQELAEFWSLLNEHLKLENDIFYPSIIKKLEEKNMDTSKTQKFFEEMKDIEAGIKVFLDNYHSETAISEKVEDLKKDLDKIISALDFRISSEEDGVYMYWTL